MYVVVLYTTRLFETIERKSILCDIDKENGITLDLDLIKTSQLFKLSLLGE